LIENVRTERHADQSKLIAGGESVGNTSSKLTHSYVTPEIKVGAAYNFNDDWALSLAYMYAFGNQVSTSINRSFNDVTLTSNNSVTGGPVALSTLTLGIRYNFA
jgi:long-subunit fatty acid transport protein